eukprot:TRINITY_DN2374_c0_g1_i1.p1 TRINITY_DN2374_c0_g1~~TRINITY_DN2374_c0_g1_i1.p1  ORF type:complete len:157 (-),score=54.68 TRINITY_DN2374_c0_g1_i1:22-492(-)
MTAKGEFFAAGLNNYGQTFMPASGTPNASFAKTKLKNIADACGGIHHSLCLTTDGKVMSTGKNDYGATGTETEEIAECNLPNKATAISAGASVSLAIVDKFPYAWGMASSWQLASSLEDAEEDVMKPSKMQGKQIDGREVLQVVGGGQHTAFLVKV